MLKDKILKKIENMNVRLSYLDVKFDLIREEHELRALRTVTWKMFGVEREEVTGKWRRLY